MSKSRRFKSTEEIVGISLKAADPCDGEAAALPIPIKRGESLNIVHLFYKEGTAPGEETVYPPHFRSTIDAETGDIVEAGPCEPLDFNVNQPTNVPTEGFGLDPGLTGEEYQIRKRRFMRLSPDIWELYSAGATTLADEQRALVADFNYCFRTIAKAPLMPYYEAIGSDFFTWLARALERSPVS